MPEFHHPVCEVRAKRISVTLSQNKYYFMDNLVKSVNVNNRQTRLVVVESGRKCITNNGAFEIASVK